MAIKSLKALNVMVFQRQWRKNNGSCMEGNIEKGDIFNDAFRLQFADGINVILGENGVGKSTILKMIYAATQWSIEKTDVGKTDKFIKFFSNTLRDSDLLKNAGRNQDYGCYEVSDGTHKFTYSLSHKGFFDYGQWLGLNIQSVFIPTTEMLSHSKGFLALNQKYKLPFDGTQVDIVVNASLPEAREIPDYMTGILEKISKVIGGQVILEDDSFYVLKDNGSKIEFSLEAEGLRKLGLLWKLIRNGLISEGTVLLWDEPEANMNPEMLPLLVDILLEMENSGVQIFIATHSYNLAKYLETRRLQEEQVKFHNLYKATSEIPKQLPMKDFNNNSDQIYSDSAYYLSELIDNKIIKADEMLLDEVFEKNLID